jgi:hypothetical protein
MITGLPSKIYEIRDILVDRRTSQFLAACERIL